MGKDREMYVEYGPQRRKRGSGSGILSGILIVIILAITVGILAYKISKNNLEALPDIPLPTPVTAVEPDWVEVRFFDGACEKI